MQIPGEFFSVLLTSASDLRSSSKSCWMPPSLEERPSTKLPKCSMVWRPSLKYLGFELKK